MRCKEWREGGRKEEKEERGRKDSVSWAAWTAQV